MVGHLKDAPLLPIRTVSVRSNARARREISNLNHQLHNGIGAQLAPLQVVLVHVRVLDEREGQTVAELLVVLACLPDLFL